MRDYKTITLSDFDREILQRLKIQGFKRILRDGVTGVITVSTEDPRGDVCLPFDICAFIEKGGNYVIEYLLDPPKQPLTVWELKLGDICYLNDSQSGRIKQRTWNPNDDGLVRARLYGDIFLTKEAAQFERSRRMSLARISEFTAPFKPGESWEPIYYPSGPNQPPKLWCQPNSLSAYGGPHFADYKSLGAAIAEIGEHDFIKYVLGVPEELIKHDQDASH